MSSFDPRSGVPRRSLTPASLATITAALALAALSPSLASARRRPPPRLEPPPPAPTPATTMPAQIERRAVELPGGRHARLMTRNGDAREPDVAALWIGSRAVALHRGSPVVGALEVGHGTLIAATAAASGARFRVHAFDATRNEPAPHRVHTVAAGGAQGFPFAVAATPTPDGFAVLFQELDPRDPSLGHTYLARLDPRGAPRGPAVEIPVPWGISAVAWNGRGYHVALIYPGGGLPRLSMVSLDESGRPQQHPDWASAMGLVGDVHLVAHGGRVLAFYRGGSDGERLLTRDVTRIGSWGREPPPARPVARLGPDDVVLVRAPNEGRGAPVASAHAFRAP